MVLMTMSSNGLLQEKDCQLFFLAVQSRALMKRISRACATIRLKPGLHEPQLPVERRVTLVSSIIVEQSR